MMVEQPDLRRHHNQSQEGNLNNHNHNGSPEQQDETSNNSKNNNSSTTTTTTTTTSTTPNNSINDSHLQYLEACKIWFNPDGARAANELKQLPLEEREKVWADLTGREATTTFTQNIIEDPIMITSKLQELKQAIVKMDKDKDAAAAISATTSTNNNNAFQLVLTSNPQYVYDAGFLLKFLRATGYNINESTIRMNQHFEMKRDLFGVEALGRDIRLVDCLDEDEDDEDAILSSGGGGCCCQPLQLTDVGGRTVVIDRPGKWTNTCSRKKLFQWIWYLRMVLSCDENIQKLGIVNVVYCLDRYQRQDLETIRLFHSQLTPAIPLKISARYAVFEDKAWKQILDFEQVIMKQPARMRFRSIQGSYEICMHSLMCVGIPIQSMPNDIILDADIGESNNSSNADKDTSNKIRNLINNNNRSDNNVIIDNYLHCWIQNRKAVESTSSSLLSSASSVVVSSKKKRQHDNDTAESIISANCDDQYGERSKIHKLKRVKR